MSIAKATRTKRKLNLSSTTIRRLLQPGSVCDGVQSVSCQKPEDQTKVDCTALQSYVVTQVPEVCKDEQRAPPAPPR